MSKEKVLVKCSGLDSEDIYFLEQEQKRLKKLRESAQKQADEIYQEGHKYHCFRCGTASLAEVDYGGIKIDVCVNEGCGAVHLDPGELEALAEASPKTFTKVRLAVLSIFR
ncbi:MAG: zf-TFIIB domain-containing protein [Thermodesulfobacteriota bacterium]